MGEWAYQRADASARAVALVLERWREMPTWPAPGSWEVTAY